MKSLNPWCFLSNLHFPKVPSQHWLGRFLPSLNPASSFLSYPPQFFFSSLRWVSINSSEPRYCIAFNVFPNVTNRTEYCLDTRQFSYFALPSAQCGNFYIYLLPRLLIELKEKKTFEAIISSTSLKTIRISSIFTWAYFNFLVFVRTRSDWIYFI